MAINLAANEKVASYTELREAANVFVNYLNSASLSELTSAKIAFEQTVSTDTDVENGTLTELLLTSTEPIPDISAFETLITDAKITLSGVNYLKVNPNDFLDPDPDLNGAEKNLTVFYHAAQKSVDYASILSDVSAVFSNLVPPVQMSLCAPYFDVKIIYPKGDSSIGALNPLRFVGLPPDDKQYSESQALGSATGVSETNKLGFDVAGMEIFCMPQTLAAPSKALNGVDAISMRGVEVLNPISPLLTIESANIQQTGINGSLYAQTKVDLNMVLHDRSRLADIAPLISVDVFPTVTMRITYGWSHPDTNKLTGNPYAKLINSMKFTQLFSVYSVSISSRDLNSLSIKMSLVSMGSLAAKGAKIITAAGKYVPYTLILSLVKQYALMKTNYSKTSADSKDTTMTFEYIPQVGSKIVSSTSGGTNYNKFVEINKFYDFYNEIIKIMNGTSAGVVSAITTNATEDLTATKLKEIVAQLQAAPSIDDETAANQSTGIFDFIYDEERDTDTTLGYGYNIKPFYDINSFIGIDFELQMSYIGGQAGYVTENTKRGTMIPLSCAIGKLVAVPLLLSLPEISEVRIHCFSFNGSCGELAEENIGNFPIVVSLLQERTETVEGKDKKIAGLNAKSSADSALNAILAQVNNPASPFYGFSSIQKKLQDSVNQIKEQYKNTDLSGLTDEQKQEATKEAQSAIDAKVAAAEKEVESVNGDILTRKNMIDGKDPAFVPPRIKAQIDVLDAYTKGETSDTASKKIARIILYDERAGGFDKLAGLVFSMANSGGIARVAKSIPGDIKDFVTKLGAATTSVVTTSGASTSTTNPSSAATSAASTDTTNSIQTIAFNSRKQYRDVALKLYPNLIVGSDAGGIINASFSSQPSGDVASSYLLTATGEDSAGTGFSDSVTNDGIADVLIIPSTINLNMIGNVCISRGQTYFVDFGTGTTLDQAYTVTGVTHTIRPGTFTTSVSMLPTNNATVKSTERQLDELIKMVENTK